MPFVAIGFLLRCLWDWVRDYPEIAIGAVLLIVMALVIHL